MVFVSSILCTPTPKENFPYTAPYIVTLGPALLTSSPVGRELLGEDFGEEAAH